MHGAGVRLRASWKNGYLCAQFLKHNSRSMVNQYETVFIATPVLSDDQVKETVEKFKDFIVANGGEVVYEESWGLRKLAYPIQNKTTGFYNLLQFKAEGEMIDKLETQFRRDERVIRFLTFRMDKYAIEYAEKRRNRRNGQAQETNETEE